MFEKREFDRIGRICNLLQEIWESEYANDLRFWQLIAIVYSEANGENLFYLEDNETEDILQRILDKHYFDGDDYEGKEN